MTTRISFSQQQDVVDHAAQQIHDGLTTLLREGQGMDHARTMAVWAVLKRLVPEALSVQDAVATWAEHRDRRIDHPVVEEQHREYGV